MSPLQTQTAGEDNLEDAVQTSAQKQLCDLVNERQATLKNRPATFTIKANLSYPSVLSNLMKLNKKKAALKKCILDISVVKALRAVRPHRAQGRQSLKERQNR